MPLEKSLNDDANNIDNVDQNDKKWVKVEEVERRTKYKKGNNNGYNRRF